VAIGNIVVAGLLRSPLHRLLSGSTDVIRYVGRRSGRPFEIPTQYARHGDDVIILVGRPEKKSWWRNFTTEHDIEVLVQRKWIPMTGLAIIGAADPASIGPLLDAYLQRFPKATRALDGDTIETRAGGAVIIRCRPR
jgi:hypothetical protein